MVPEQDDALSEVAEGLERLHQAALALERAQAGSLAGLPLDRARSARNLLHYLALRGHDLRGLQTRLSQLGLSSLGRAEPHVLATLEAVQRLVDLLRGEASAEPPAPPLVLGEGAALLAERTTALLGPEPAGRATRIMVTLPSEAAEDGSWARDLLAAGADCVRINCAHDGPAAWAAMIEHVRRAAHERGRTCMIQMDLAGPKLRTGPIVGGPQVVTWRPRRDALGGVLQPARVWLTPAAAPVAPPGPADAVLPVEGDWLEEVEVGDDLRLVDARGSRRRLRVLEAVGVSRWASARKRAYVTPGTELRPARGEPGRVGALPPVPQRLRLARGDLLLLSRRPEPGRPAQLAPDGTVLAPARIACSLPEALQGAAVGQRVVFDDGRLAGTIEAVGPEGLRVRIQEARDGGDWLGADKGINLPDRSVDCVALTPKDIQDLGFAARHADAVGLSFVERPEDVEALRRELTARGAERLGIVLKIETRRAFEALPQLLLAALAHPRSGVMIARGDLAAECGFERLAELQEELLWMCEAAHLPAIWATEVLAGLAKDGRPTRAEMTDAAAAQRAECVMLNKGRHLARAVRSLDDVLRRMRAHQEKKRAMLRPLHLGDALRAAAGV